MVDKIKIGLALLLVVAGLAGFYYFGESPAIVRLGYRPRGAKKTTSRCRPDATPGTTS